MFYNKIFSKEKPLYFVPLTALSPCILKKGLHVIIFTLGPANYVTDLDCVKRMEGGNTGRESFND